MTSLRNSRLFAMSRAWLDSPYPMLVDHSGGGERLCPGPSLYMAGRALAARLDAELEGPGVGVHVAATDPVGWVEAWLACLRCRATLVLTDAPALAPELRLTGAGLALSLTRIRTEGRRWGPSTRLVALEQGRCRVWSEAALEALLTPDPTDELGRPCGVPGDWHAPRAALRALRALYERTELHGGEPWTGQGSRERWTSKTIPWTRSRSTARRPSPTTSRRTAILRPSPRRAASTRRFSTTSR